MGAVEDEGGRPVHRAREWQQAARRLDKETKTANWHKQNPDQIAAPLILNPANVRKPNQAVKRGLQSVSED